MEISFLFNILIFLVIATFYITVGSLFFAPFIVKAIEPILHKFFNVSMEVLADTNMITQHRGLKDKTTG